jgi:hypothetical protein
VIAFLIFPIFDSGNFTTHQDRAGAAALPSIADDSAMSARGGLRSLDLDQDYCA